MRTYLQKCLDQISKGELVDWPRIRVKLMDQGVTQNVIEKALKAEAFTAKQYRITILDHSTFKELYETLGPADLSSRASASKTGPTHKAAVEGAMLTVWAVEDEIPHNLIFKPGMKAPKPKKRTAFIIENLECFLNKEEVYAFARRLCGFDIPEDKIEFIWGAGNSITNWRIVPFLKQYSQGVYCLFDIDYGGIKTFANLLAAGLRPESTHYLVPADLCDRLEASKKKVDQKVNENLSKVYGISTEIDNIIKAIRHYGATIEQESYRA